MRELDRSGVRALAYRHTGCGMNACNQSAQLLWLKRHAPEVLARAATACHCKDWLYFKLTGERVTDVSEGTFTFGDFRTRAYAPEVLAALGLEGERAPARDGRRQPDHAPLTAAAAAATGLPEGLPVALGYVDVLCTALGGGGIYEPGRAIGCSIVGSTGMHMRFVPDAAEVRLGPEPSGYTMPFPVPGSAAQMQSNMAATLNIDWVVELSREAAELLGHAVDRAKHWRRSTPVCSRACRRRPLPPLHPRGGRTWPFVDPAPGPSSPACRRGSASSTWSAPSTRAWPWPRDCYAAMGHVPEEIRVAGGARRSKALRTILASALARRCARARARRRCGGCRDDGGGGGRRVPRHGADPAEWVTPLLGDLVLPDPELPAATPGSSRLRRDAPGDAADLGRARGLPHGATHMSDARSPSSATASCCPRRSSPRCAHTGAGLVVRTLELPWPDEPMTHGYAAPGSTG